MKIDMVLNGLLSQVSLNSPDGRLLCKYRCSEILYEELREALIDRLVLNHYSFTRFGQKGSAAFCLFASEWWRKNYAGGKWSYSGILESLGLASNSNRQELYGPIRDGLRFWRRELLTVGVSNAYLVTLVCEGGIPLNLLHNDADSKLRRYLQNLLREFRTYGGGQVASFELASRLGHTLPLSLRQDPLYKLCGELIEQVWLLQSQMGNHENPVEMLDARVPEWRDKFPLVVSDRAAQALLNNLVREASSIARIQEIKVTTSLLSTSEGYRLVRTTHLPSYFNIPSLSSLTGIGANDLPYRMYLYDYSCEEHKLLGLITKRTAGEQARFAVESPHSETPSMEGTAAARQVFLQARSGESVIDLTNIKGSLPLSELPWVFAQNGDTQDQWRLIGEGSLKTKFREVLVAVDSNSRIEVEEGDCQEVGVIELFGRKIYRVSGVVAFDCEESQAHMATSTDEDESSQFLLYGPHLSAGLVRNQVYCGFPKIQRCYEDGRTVNLLPEQLEWKPQGASSPWQPISSNCAGPVMVRHAPNGKVNFISSLEIVPLASTLRFIPGPTPRVGAITVDGFEIDDCGIPQADNIVIKKSSSKEGFCFDVSCDETPPAALPLHLRWPDHREIVLTVPYPARGARFIGRDGAVLKTDGKVHISQLSGVLVQVIEPEDPGVRYMIEASVISENMNYANYQLKSEGPYLVEVTPGRHELDMRMLEEKCRLLFSGTRDLDAWIRISVLSNKGDSFAQKIYVARYDLTLTPHKQTSEVYIPPNEREGSLKGFSKLEVKAFPLGCPECDEMEVLPQTNEGHWQFETENRSVGPWLLTGWSGDWCRTRPLCWTVYNDDETVSDNVKSTSLEQCVAISNYEQRKSAIDRVLEELIAHPGDDEWKKVYGYFNLTKDLPAVSFDVLVRISKSHDAAATALINSPKDSFDCVWTGMERLPFMWALIPVESWLAAARKKKEHLVQILEPLVEIMEKSLDDLILDSMESFFEQTEIRFSGIKVTSDLIRNVFLSTPLTDTELRSVTTKPNRDMLCQFCITEPGKELMQVHAEDYWPTFLDLEEKWWPKYREFVPVELHSLWKSEQSAGYRSSVLNAPVVAAFSVAFGLHVNKYFAFHLRRLREFDRNWFDTTYGCTLASSIGYRIENGMSYDNQ